MSSVPSWLADPTLTRLWDAVRERLERHHLEPTGRLILTDLTRDERHAVGGLLGRTLVTERVTIELAQLDRELARRSPFRGLVETVTALSGRPLRDRRAERSARDAAREKPFALARQRLDEDDQLASVPWGETWLAGIRRSGLLTRSDNGVETMRRAMDVLAQLLTPREADEPAVSRTDLAVQIAGGAHGLDDNTALAQIVLRALALDANSAPPPSTAATRRELWDRYGVAVDSVSATCLVLGMTARGGGSQARRLLLAADAGDPVHLTAWDLHDLDLAPHRAVLVCENPRVLEVIAQSGAGSVPVVCTAGQAALVVIDVLRRLAAEGATLHYHGDFDWPGIAIANRLVDEAGVRPWRMAAADYLAAERKTTASLELRGRAVTATWDPELTTAMARQGVAVHEEAVLDELLAGLPSLR